MGREEIFVLFGCYPKEMDGNQEEIHNILVALLSGDEKEIYKVLYKKKEIDDKTPKLRTEDEKKKLKSLSYQMRKFPKNLIDGIQKNFRFYKEHLKQLNKEKNKSKSVRGKNMLQKAKKKQKRDLISKKSMNMKNVWRRVKKKKK